MLAGEKFEERKNRENITKLLAISNATHKHKSQAI